MLSAAEFDLIVEEALRRIPKRFRQKIENVAIVVEAEPPQPNLLGLYQGQSLAADSFFRAGGEQPPRISIYRGPILRLCESPEEVVQEVYDTVVHELGHHVGLDDDEMPY